jgi:hypothetical protein
MAQYLVTMSLAKAEPLIDIGHLTNIVTEKVLPSLDALKDLQSKGKVLAGGHPVGQHYVMLLMEAESEEEVRKLVGELPLSELGDTAVTELKSFEELQDPVREPGEGSYPNVFRRGGRRRSPRQAPGWVGKSSAASLQPFHKMLPTSTQRAWRSVRLSTSKKGGDEPSVACKEVSRKPKGRTLVLL